MFLLHTLTKMRQLTLNNRCEQIVSNFLQCAVNKPNCSVCCYQKNQSVSKLVETCQNTSEHVLIMLQQDYYSYCRPVSLPALEIMNMMKKGNLLLQFQEKF